MTSAKTYHKQARALMIQHLDMHPGRTVDADLDPAEVGIVGDLPHAEEGDSYHLGKSQIRARSGRDRYSVDESRRDQRGLDDFASAMDIGWFKVTTRRGTFTLRDYSIWLVGLCRAGDPDTVDLREVIYSPDGKVVKRWDREGRRSSGDDSHLSHTHESEYRDATGARMLKLATRWLQHIGLIEEDDDMTPEDREQQATILLAIQQTAQSVLTAREQIGKVLSAVTADASRDAQVAAVLAGMQTALSAIASAGGALTPAQVATLTDQVASAAKAAGDEAVSTIAADLRSLRQHLGDDTV